MRRLAFSLALLFFATSSHAAERKFDPDAAAMAVAPFLDDRTVAVLHVDLTRIDVDAFADKLGTATKAKKEELAEERKHVTLRCCKR